MFNPLAETLSVADRLIWGWFAEWQLMDDNDEQAAGYGACTSIVGR